MQAFFVLARLAVSTGVRVAFNTVLGRRPLGMGRLLNLILGAANVLLFDSPPGDQGQ